MPPVPPEQRALNEIVPLAYRMRDAERVAGVSKSKLYQLAADGKLKLTRVGGRTLVPHTELQRLIDKGSLPPKDQKTKTDNRPDPPIDEGLAVSATAGRSQAGAGAVAALCRAPNSSG